MSTSLERGTTCFLLALCAFLLEASPLSAAQVSVRYTLTDEPGSDQDAGTWRVEVEVNGLHPQDGAMGLVSSDWGWPQGEPYLEVLECEPELAELGDDGSTMTLAVPERWNGCARVVYRVSVCARGSQRHLRHGLLPTRGSGYAYGNSDNVLLRPNQAGEFFAAEVEVDIVASDPQETLTTGWGGLAHGRQHVTLDTPWGNSPVIFGAPAVSARTRSGAFEVECFQFCGPDVSAHVMERVARLASAMERATGFPARSPSRVFLSDAMSGGMASEHGLHLNVPADALPGFEFDHFFETTLAHELFHEWLGVRLHESHGSLVWFREGFTEYFSQWFAVSTGILPPATFAENLESYDRYARSSTSLGAVAFADPGVNWRDGDGPNELMAYRGAPILALALDVELRSMGRPGILQLVRDLLARDDPVFPPEALHEWFLENGLEESWKRSVAGREVPTAADALRRAGFVARDVPVDVAYLGLETIERKPIWEVLSVDPEGPAEKAGVLPGDIIDGFFPFTGTPTRLQPLTTPYTFGLAIFTPGIEGSFLGIVREGEPLKLFVEPERRPWGLRTEWQAPEPSDGSSDFFVFTPR